MQTSFLPVTIVDNPVHPISSVQAYNRTTPIAMVLQPCAGKSLPLLCRGTEVVSALADEQGRIRYSKPDLIANGNQAMNREPKHPIPLHSALKNACAFQSVCELASFPRSIVDYRSPFLS